MMIIVIVVVAVAAVVVVIILLIIKIISHKGKFVKEWVSLNLAPKGS